MIPSFVFVLLALSLGCSSGSGSDGSPNASSSEASSPAELLNLECAFQERQEWTLATSTSIVLRYFLGEDAASPCEILAALVSPNCCEDPLPCAAPGSTFTIQQALQLFGGFGSVVTLPLSFNAIQIEIDAGRPVMIVYTGSFQGHVVVVYGYNAESGEIYLCDPFLGDFVVPYDFTFQYADGTFSWGSTVARIL
ncbi:MAG: BtrH N-terminal domain-containing protein [bacterium]|nr:BtrH N-terminal domain-containing protein [bacterium]